MDVRTEMLVFQDLKDLTEAFAPDVRWDIRVDVRRISDPKTYSLGCFFVLDVWDTPNFIEARRPTISQNLLWGLRRSFAVGTWVKTISTTPTAPY